MLNRLTMLYFNKNYLNVTLRRDMKNIAFLLVVMIFRMYSIQLIKLYIGLYIMFKVIFSNKRGCNIGFHDLAPETP